MTMNADGATGKACPICGKPAIERYLPFCSARCTNIDLGRWLKGNYAIPAEPLDDPEQDHTAQDDAEDEGGARA
ncbi:hypothetical protein SAMN05444161_2016 [Rhizobiales bacterium GAS191]|nr:hypothetical protein SAMN05444161_2016 [Rhizobiales bacterium GAS191]